jgi:ribose transport system substrate-binding protein
MVFTINDQEAIGADLAARQLNHTDFLITSVEGAPDIVESLKQPDSLIEASSSQDPYAMAHRHVPSANKLLAESE